MGENKDSNAESQFEQLNASFGARFKRMIMTSHTLMPGELDGKSSSTLPTKAFGLDCRLQKLNAGLGSRR